jgi:hypothetical protein
LQEEVLVTAYLPHEGDPFIVELSQQPPSTAIDCIEGHMSETYPMAPRPEDHLPCKLHLALRHSRRLRDLYRIESRRIVEPTLRQIQARVDKRDRGLFRECGEDAHLAVLHLPQPPIPLPCDPRRGLALLRKRALVDEESRFHSADKRVDLTARLADWRAGTSLSLDRLAGVGAGQYILPPIEDVRIGLDELADARLAITPLLCQWSASMPALLPRRWVCQTVTGGN